jgi:hypothetical protein
MPVLATIASLVLAGYLIVWILVPGLKGHPMRRFAAVLGLILGMYLIGRAVAEPFVINMTDSATYHNDWGGPSLLGVLAVHCGPGLLAAAGLGHLIRRRLEQRRVTQPSAPLAGVGAGTTNVDGAQ